MATLPIIPLTFIATLWGRVYYLPHFINDKTEVHKDEATFPTSHCWEVPRRIWTALILEATLCSKTTHHVPSQPERERNHWKSTEPSWPAPGQGEAVRNPFLWCSSGLLLQWAKCGNLVWVLDREYSEDSVSPESLWMNSSEFTVPSHSELFLIHLYINHQPCVLPKP